MLSGATTARTRRDMLGRYARNKSRAWSENTRIVRVGLRCHLHMLTYLRTPGDAQKLLVDR
jgi:hypothetical protein